MEDISKASDKSSPMPAKVLVSKKTVLVAAMLVIALMLGVLIGEQIRIASLKAYLQQKRVKNAKVHEQLAQEKGEYESALEVLTSNIEEWNDKHADNTWSEAEKQAHIQTFHDQAANILTQFSDLEKLLEEKKERLDDQEDLLQFQTQSITDGEAIRQEMESYVIELGKTIMKIKKNLPEGLVDEPFFYTNVDVANYQPKV